MALIKRILRSDWSASAFFLVAFLCTNRYIYGWDNQHLEITLLKHLIDPGLFAGDYYVESLAKNFSSFLYPLLARLITVDMIPAAYLVLFCIARFFLFYWIYRFWQLISEGDRPAAFFATLGLFLLGRPESLVIRTFNHETFAYPLIFAAIYFFYKNRFLPAALLLGLMANFHALYSLFPMMYLAVYTLLFVKDGGKTFLKSGLIFVAAALPFLCWHLPGVFHHGPTVPASEWVPLYLESCPQCFPLGTANPNDVVSGFGDFFSRLYPYFFLAALYAAHCFFNPVLRSDKKAHVIFWVSAALIAANFFFAYVIPSRFVLDLNLTRTAQYVKFLLMGYTVIFLMKEALRDRPIYAVLAGFAYLLIGWADEASFFHRVVRDWPILLALGILAGILYWKKDAPYAGLIKRAFLAVPLAGMFIAYCFLHYNFVQISTKGGGFWQLQRNWEDMQFYVRDHTPKNAMILAPYDMEMGGFRIHSNRKVVVCFRDCGIIGFDYAATKEWQQRMADIDTFKVFIKEPVVKALVNGIFKYGADYVVFMKYAAPPDNGLLKKMYANETFTLYKVTR